MTTEHPHIFEPLRLASHDLVNRVVLAPMKTGFASAGLDSAELIGFYKERAENESLGLVIIGNNAIDATARIHPLDSSTDESGWTHARALTNALHAEKAKVVAQLVHNGNDVRHPANFSSSRTFNPDTGRTGLRTPGLLASHFINTYVAQAYRAVEDGGFDGVEIYGGHRSLPNCFSSMAINKRGDKWGLKNGFRFHLRLIRELRRQLGDEPIILFRLSLMELVPDGSDWESVVRLARLLHKHGVDAFTFEIGLSANQCPVNADLTPPGVWFPFMRMLAEEAEVPVVFGKKLPGVDEIDRTLAEVPGSLFEIERPLVADSDWVSKVRSGDTDSIIPCVECPQRCLSSYKGNRPRIHCVANPRLIRSNVESVSEASTKPLVIVGGGPAGMAAAATARRIGREVHLVDEREQLGGLFRLAAAIPGRERIPALLDKQAALLEESGVEITLNQKVTADWLRENHPVADILLCTGTTSKIPDIPGVDSPNVYTFEDLLTSSWTRRRHIAVIGNSSLTLDLARFFCPKKSHNCEEFLNAWGIGDPREHQGGVKGVIPELFTSYRSMYLILTAPLSQLDEALTNAKRHYELDWLRMNGVRVFSNARIEQIDNSHIRLVQAGLEEESNEFKKNHIVIPDSFEIPDELVVVVAENLEPRMELAEALSGLQRSFAMAGSMKKEERLWGANLAAYDGHMMAIELSR